MTGAEIKSIRLDVLKDQGLCELDYIELVSKETCISEIDPEKTDLTYSFYDLEAGNADGVIKIDFNGQDTSYVQNAILYWACEENGEYVQLPEYTQLRLLNKSEIEQEYIIDKNLLIPPQVTALAAKVICSGCEFVKYFELPPYKLATDYGEPLYTAAFISDTHIGGWGSEKAPAERLIKTRQGINALADFVVVNGDLTQWYGAYSGDAFGNYHDSIYNDNGERSEDPSLLYAGTSQWEILEEWLKGFEIPVYAVQGNHDIPDSSRWNPVCCTGEMWENFFNKWIEYSTTTDSVRRYASAPETYQGKNYYCTNINGYAHIFLQIPREESPNYAFDDEQLAWLDMKLFDMEESGKPVFVFGHVPLENELSGGYWDDQIKAAGYDAAFKAVLERHPTAVYVSGHTHYSLDTDFLGVINGKGENYSLINNSGTATISVPKDEANPDDITEKLSSHGVIAEVYEDCILVRGRDFVNGQWISRGLSKITFSAPCSVQKPEVVR